MSKYRSIGDLMLNRYFQYTKIGLLLFSMLFLANCGGDDDDSSESSSKENSVTIAGTTIPLTLDTEDKIFSQKVLEWNDGNTFSYLEQNKKVMTYFSTFGNYSSYSEMDGYWDVREDNNELWVLFKDGELYRFEVTTDGNNYIQYITQINNDARPAHLVGIPEQSLLEQIVQDNAVNNSVPNSDMTDAEFNRTQTERLRGKWEFVSDTSGTKNYYTFDTSLEEDGNDIFYISDSNFIKAVDGDRFLAAYISSLKKFTLTVQIIGIKVEWVFDFVDDNTIKGTYTGNTSTQTFSFHGNRLSN